MRHTLCRVDFAVSVAALLPGTVFYVTGCRGRLRCVLLVRCGYCKRMHQHTATAEFINGWRKASCGHGRYLVHAVAVEEAVA